MPACEPRIIIIGGGPTGLGAAVRLQELGFVNWQLFEREKACGGLASSIVDDQLFTWDIGGHVLFSHYQYYDDIIDKLGPREFRSLERKCVLFMDKGERVVTYPLQNHIHELPTRYQRACLDGLEEAHRAHLAGEGKGMKCSNFFLWGLRTFGRGLVDVFLRPYNEKLWAWPLEAMSAVWLGERVAVPDFEVVKKQFESGTTQAKNWGPNNTFKYPAEGGTGSIWTSIASHLDQSKLLCNQPITKIDVQRKTVTTASSGVHTYDFLINTMPLPLLADVMTGAEDDIARLRELAASLKYSSVRVTGLGVEGPTPACLDLFQWSYFPDSDAPFYRCTALTNYTPKMAPEPDKQYSLLLESSSSSWRPEQRSKEELIESIIKAAREYGLILPEATIVSKWHWVAEFGYPTPSVDRDSILDEIEALLLKYNIHSRGRFGGWRYESSNMDHSLMQGVEAADAILHTSLGGMDASPFKDEPTYRNPNFVNDPANRSTVRFSGFASQ